MYNEVDLGRGHKNVYRGRHVARGAIISNAVTVACLRRTWRERHGEQSQRRRERFRTWTRPALSSGTGRAADEIGTTSRRRVVAATKRQRRQSRVVGGRRQLGGGCGRRRQPRLRRRHRQRHAGTDRAPALRHDTDVRQRRRDPTKSYTTAVRSSVDSKSAAWTATRRAPLRHTVVVQTAAQFPGTEADQRAGTGLRRRRATLGGAAVDSGERAGRRARGGVVCGGTDDGGPRPGADADRGTDGRGGGSDNGQSSLHAGGCSGGAVEHVERRPRLFTGSRQPDRLHPRRSRACCSATVDDQRRRRRRRDAGRDVHVLRVRRRRLPTRRAAAHVGLREPVQAPGRSVPSAPAAAAAAPAATVCVARKRCHAERRRSIVVFRFYRRRDVQRG